jgi:hypothetical protein
VLFGLPASTLALILMFLAAMDSFATFQFVLSEQGRELNPVMLWMLDVGPTFFVFYKLLLTGWCAQWIVTRASRPDRIGHARMAALVGLAIYVPVVGLHILNHHVVGALS